MSWELVAIIVTVVIFAVFAIGAVLEWMDERNTKHRLQEIQKQECIELTAQIMRSVQETQLHIIEYASLLKKPKKPRKHASRRMVR